MYFYFFKLKWRVFICQGLTCLYAKDKVLFRLPLLTVPFIFTKKINMIYQKLHKTFSFIALLGLVCCLGCKREVAAASAKAIVLTKALDMSSVSLEDYCNSPAAQHAISLDTALKLIKNYQNAIKIPGKLCQLYERAAHIVKAETFPATIIKAILNQANVCALRIYNGLGDDNMQHLVIVGVNSNGYDVISANQAAMNVSAAGPTAGLICEMGTPCPYICNGVFQW